MRWFLTTSLVIASLYGSAAASPPKGTPILARGFFCGNADAAKAVAKLFNDGQPTLEATVAEIVEQNIPCALAQGSVLYEGKVDSLIIGGVSYEIDALKVGDDTYYTFHIMDGQAI